MARGTTTKRTSAPAAAALVRSGDWVDYGAVLAQPDAGIVNLKGRSISERAQAMISIAHPDFRDDLEREARENGLTRKVFV